MVLAFLSKVINNCFPSYLADFQTKYRYLYFRFQVHIQVCVKSAQGLQNGMKMTIDYCLDVQWNK